VTKRSIIAKSDQIWKVAIGLILLIGGGATDATVSFLLAAPHGSFAHKESMYVVQVVSTGASLLGFVYLCARVRCPQCGAKWIWMGVTGKLRPKSLDTLVTLERCPTCDYGGIAPIQRRP
jgi:hypothetical protein